MVRLAAILYREEQGATMAECIILAVLVAISAVTGWHVMIGPALTR
jgi:Flp pilus assembly pilin Flp